MKKILVSLMVILLAAGLVGGGAFAYLNDTETSTGNTFNAGTLDLKVSDLNESGDGVTATWTMSNMAPGVTTTGGSWDVTLRNSGTIAADHVEISFSHSIDEDTNPPGFYVVESDTNPNSTAAEMARWIEITSCTYSGATLMSSLSNLNGNGFLDLEDVTLGANAAEGGVLDNLLAPVGAGTTTFSMALKFNAGATNDIQGDILTTTVTFILNQDISQ